MTDIAEPRHRSYLEKTLGTHAAYKPHYHFARTIGDTNVAQAKAYLDGQKEHHGS